MPTQLVTAAILATGYQGPVSIEVFNHSLNDPGSNVPEEHAIRGISGLQKLYDAVKQLPDFWDVKKSVSVESLVYSISKQS